MADNRQMVEEVINSVRSTNLLMAVMSKDLRFVSRGMHYLALCPFHNDKKLGAFVVTPAKQIWKCFACGEGGDSIKFYSMYYNVSYVEAAFKIALEHGLINDYMYKEYFERRRFTASQLIHIERRYTELDRDKFKNDIADEATLNEVFTLFIKTVGEYYAADESGKYDGLLSKEHKKHLMEVRGLTEEDIVNGNFFTFPKGYIMKRFGKAVKQAFKGRYQGEYVLSRIPGFYREKGKDYFTMATLQGIGMGIKNARGNIIGIQVRRDQVKSTSDGGKEQRYVWFSSSFANLKPTLELGTSSGSPIDVIFPKEVTARTIFITEGRFKAIALSKAVNAVVLSVQGVSTWRGVVAELDYILKSKTLQERWYSSEPFVFDSVNIAFDADSHYNYSVFTQARKMADYLKQNGYYAYYLNWPEDCGKGIDDVILAGHKGKISKYEKIHWDKSYDDMVEQIIKDHKDYKKPQDIEPSVFKEYFKKMMNIAPVKRGQQSKEHEKYIKDKNAVSA